MTYRNKKNLKVDRELSLIISDGPDKSFSVMRIGTLRSTTRQPRRRSVNIYKQEKLSESWLKLKWTVNIFTMTLILELKNSI